MSIIEGIFLRIILWWTVQMMPKYRTQTYAVFHSRDEISRNSGPRLNPVPMSEMWQLVWTRY